MEWREDELSPDERAGEYFSFGGAPWLQALSDRLFGKRDQPNPIGTLTLSAEEPGETLDEEESSAA